MIKYAKERQIMMERLNEKKGMMRARYEERNAEMVK